MKMQYHILAAMREQFDQWQNLLASMSDERINAPRAFADWSIKDVIAHLYAWQQRSIERVNAALENREPNFPKWLGDADPDENANAANAKIFKMYHDQAWSTVYQKWRDGFLHFLEVGEKFSEQDFLDSGRYAWLEGHPLAAVYLWSYEHHQEHFEKLVTAV